MLSAQIDAVLADFVRRRTPFSHRDVAARIPGLPAYRLDDVRQLVMEKMQGVSGYRVSVVHFVGEGLTLVCSPRDAAPATPPSKQTSASESGRLVA